VDTSFGQLQGEQHGDRATSGLAWPTYDPPRRATMIFDLEPGIMDAPREAERRFWERV
jgi:carboxylesterase type B